MSKIPKSLQGTLSYANDSKLAIDGVSVDHIANYGTPTIVLSEKRLVDNYESIEQAFVNEAISRGQDARIAYSTKTNPLILQTMRDKFRNIDVASPIEIELGKKAGFYGNEMIYNGPKSVMDLMSAVAEGVYINIDSVEEYSDLKRIAESTGEKINFGVRVNLSQEILSKEELLYDEKGPFGLTEREATDIYKDAKNHKLLNANGIHTHALLHRLTLGHIV